MWGERLSQGRRDRRMTRRRIRKDPEVWGPAVSEKRKKNKVGVCGVGKN